jgi:hypothetical protein
MAHVSRNIYTKEGSNSIELWKRSVVLIVLNVFEGNIVQSGRQKVSEDSFPLFRNVSCL